MQWAGPMRSHSPYFNKKTSKSLCSHSWQTLWLFFRTWWYVGSYQEPSSFGGTTFLFHIQAWILGCRISGPVIIQYWTKQPGARTSGKQRDGFRVRLTHFEGDWGEMWSRALDAAPPLEMKRLITLTSQGWEPHGWQHHWKIDYWAPLGHITAYI